MIIPTKNHPERLGRCLASLLEAGAQLGHCEILVMDNSDSAFRRRNAAAVAGFDSDVVRWVPMDSVGLMAARHEGAHAAKGDLISFIDDDERVFPTWLSAVQSCFTSPEVALATGPFRPSYEGTVPHWLESLWVCEERGRWLGYLTLLELRDSEEWIDPVMVWGGNLTIRKSVFTEVRGSHPDFLPDPWAAYQGDGEVGLTVKVAAAGYRARYSPAAGVWHAVPEERMTLEHLERRAWNIGLHTSYTRYRRENGLGPHEGVPLGVHAAAPRLTRRAARAVRRKARALRESAAALVPTQGVNQRASVVAEVRARLDQVRSHAEEWHREQLAGDADVAAWVLRRDYMDVSMPRVPAGSRRDQA